MNTTENNKLIAEFMGGLWNEPAQKYGIGNAQYVDNGTFKNVVKAKYHYSLNELLYHSDWNWLMEVVEKIESLGYNTKIESLEHTRVSIGNGKLTTLIQVDKETKIEAVYNACVTFIEWYNKQTAEENK